MINDPSWLNGNSLAIYVREKEKIKLNILQYLIQIAGNAAVTFTEY